MKSKCTIYSEYCPEHDFVHGAEAEELREGIEKFIAGGDNSIRGHHLQRLLDRVDARDSLAFLDAQGDTPKKRATKPETGDAARHIVIQSLLRKWLDAHDYTQRGAHHLETLLRKAFNAGAKDAKSKPRMFPLQKASPIPWEVAEKAYRAYAAKYGSGQSLERLAERGGFSPGEMDMFYPEWQETTRCIEELRLENAQLRERILVVDTELNRYENTPPTFAELSNLQDEIETHEKGLVAWQKAAKRALGMYEGLQCIVDLEDAELAADEKGLDLLFAAAREIAPEIEPAAQEES